MAWGAISGRYTFEDQAVASTSGNVTTIIGSSSVNIASGSVIFVFVASDNTTSGDSQTSLVSSLSDASGNTYSKAIEFTNGQTGAASGATVSIWKCETNADLVLDTHKIVVNFASNVAAKGVTGKAFSKTSGNTVSITASATNATDGASPATMSISGLGSNEYLWLHAVATEGVSGNAITISPNYNRLLGAGTVYDEGSSGGGGGSNMSVYAEYRINTATTDQVGSVGPSADHAQAFIAVREKAGADPGATSGSGSITFSQNAVLTGSGALVAAANQGITFAQAASLTGSGALVAAANQGITFGESASLGAFTFGVGTASLTFAESATLTATGALVATDGFVFAQNATLTGAGALIGTAAITFGQDALLNIDVPIVGAASIDFAQNATLTGSGALVAAADQGITFGQNATLGTVANEALVGSADLVFAQDATLTGAGALVGTGALTFNQDATLKGDLPFVASAAIIFGQAATLSGSGALVGTGTITFSQAATMQGAGALVGAGTVTFGQDATLTGAGALAGTATVTFSQNATLSGAGAGAMVGSASVSFGQAAILVGDLGLSAIANLIFGAEGTLNRPAEQEVTDRPRPDDGPYTYKPTGLLHRPKKARKDVETRVEESRDIAREVAEQVAREFSEENEALLKPISKMSQEEIAAEIALRLQPLVGNVQSLQLSQDDEVLILLMAGI